MHTPLSEVFPTVDLISGNRLGTMEPARGRSYLGCNYLKFLFICGFCTGFRICEFVGVVVQQCRPAFLGQLFCEKPSDFVFFLFYIPNSVASGLLQRGPGMHRAETGNRAHSLGCIEG